MSNKVVVDGTNGVSAQQLSELFRQIGAGEISGSELQAFIEHRNSWVVMETVTHYLRLVTGRTEIIIGATDGKQTIAQAKDVFPGDIDPNLVNYGTDVMGKPTPDTKVLVYELIRDGDFVRIFESFKSATMISMLCLSQSQIIRFASYHSEWFRTDSYETFFLFKEDGCVFVAGVSRRSCGLEVEVFAFPLSRIWKARCGYQFVVPQLL